MNKDELAKAAAAKMLSTDAASHMLGIELQEVSPGFAKARMAVRADMVNGHDIAHGGIVFTLADTAFACACNSHNIVNVAANCTVNFVRPALRGDVLTASAREQSLGRRSGVYDVRVDNQDGKLVALFRGHSMSFEKPVVEEI